MLPGLLALVGVAVELAEAEMAVGDEGAHAARLGKAEGLTIVRLASPGLQPLLAGGNIPEEE